MQIGIIGEGAIGRYVIDALAGTDSPAAVVLTRPARLAERAATGLRRIAHASDLPDGISLMLDCAGHAALREHGPDILARGTDLITLSIGALADRDLENRLQRAADAGGSQLHLASGAIGALDCLQAARAGGLTEVTYTGRKPPAGWRGSAAEEVVDLDNLEQAHLHFDGTAREAALRYPKNANVTAAVALAGTGFDNTRARLIADPDSSGNIHEVSAKGAFGSFTFRIEGNALPDNPRSSALAAMSVLSAIARRRDRITL